MKRLTFIFLAVITAAQVYSQGWQVDKSHSAISFTVPHLVISDVTGNFGDWDIEVTTSGEDFTDMKVKATVKVASINTDNAKRDEHLKGDDFFNAGEYPEIRFNGYSVYKVDDKNYKITGDLTIRDVTKKVMFDAVNQGSVKSPWGQTVSVWKATTKINRFDYKLKWDAKIESGGLVVGDMVTINLTIELVK
ncbi:MAG TPA: YceI family protein [Bacteroidales bacterium]|nr:YceI family protein [Bacteroidales bacterium]HSA43143.1 YceI family protein [Bacteroidales bacterium]